jgi:hypothetical protein
VSENGRGRLLIIIIVIIVCSVGILADVKFKIGALKQKEFQELIEKRETDAAKLHHASVKHYKDLINPKIYHHALSQQSKMVNMFIPDISSRCIYSIC